MSTRSLRDRIERLEARTSLGYVIGQDRVRDRRRRTELFHLGIRQGLTDAQKVEKAQLDAFFKEEDSDRSRRAGLFYKDLYCRHGGGPALTEAERIEWAQLTERYPPDPDDPHRKSMKELAEKLREAAR